MAQKIKTIVFDFGGVLIDWNPKYLFRKIFATEEEMNHFLNHVCTPDWNEQQDAGRTVKEAAEVLIPKFPAYKSQIEAFYGRWPEMLGGPIHGTVQILRKLKENGQHRLIGLTNWSVETFPVAKARYDFLHLFEGILVSGEEKLRKPDPVFYQLLLDRYDIDPTSAIFIDDSARNVKASNDFGLPAVRFVGAEQLKKDLQALEVEL